MKRIRHTLAAAALGIAIAGCAAPPAALECRRLEAASLNPENDFKALVDGGEAFLDSAPDRIDITFSVIRPVDKEVTLVQVIGGKEAGRWGLRIGADSGLRARCIIGLPDQYSNCHAEIADAPHPVGGYYYLQSNGNRVLEAGLAFRLCR